MRQECYQFIRGPNNKVTIIGFGSYGQVKLAKNTLTDQIVAIKFIYGRNAKQEIDVHHKLTHPNIIKLLNYNYDKQKNATYMVLQYASGGTLHNRIKFGYGQLSKQKIKKYFHDVCRAVQYLHSLKYMHRDIKPENILLTHDDHAKICDFGVAAILQFRSTLCGTYQYMAPQMIQSKPYDYKVDIWALGILLFQLIQGMAPFRGQSGQDVINEMKKPIIFSNRFDKQQIQLIKKILRVNAQNRPTVTTILQHSYFYNDKDIYQDKYKHQLSNSPNKQQYKVLDKYQNNSINNLQQKYQFIKQQSKDIKSQYKIPAIINMNKNKNYNTVNCNQSNHNITLSNNNSGKNMSVEIVNKIATTREKSIPTFLTQQKTGGIPYNLKNNTNYNLNTNPTAPYYNLQNKQITSINNNFPQPLWKKT